FFCQLFLRQFVKLCCVNVLPKVDSMYGVQRLKMTENGPCRRLFGDCLQKYISTSQFQEGFYNFLLAFLIFYIMSKLLQYLIRLLLPLIRPTACAFIIVILLPHMYTKSWDIACGMLPFVKITVNALLQSLQMY
ncbi:hypothetical protein Bhyg_04344, partial [Pseudolycoriella hygida]